MKLKPPKKLQSFTRLVCTKAKGFVRAYPKYAPYVQGVATLLCGVTAWRGGAKCERIIQEYGEIKPSEVAKNAAAPIIFGGISIVSGFATRTITKGQIAGLMASNALLLRNMDSEVSPNDICDDESTIVLDPDGELFYDSYTHLKFRQDPKLITDAFYKMNRAIQFSGFASLGSLYMDYGFSKEEIPSGWDSVGWMYDDVLDEIGVSFLDVILDKNLFPYNDKTGKFDIIPGEPQIIDYRIDPSAPFDNMCDDYEYATKYWFM